MPSFTLKTFATALVGAASVSAHGHVTMVTVNGKNFTGFNPFMGGINANTLTATTVGWGTTLSNNGFVPAGSLGTSDIACGNNSQAAPGSVTLAAGDTMTLQWDQWDFTSHKGPIINYLANCGDAGCAKAEAGSLEFFKISQDGLNNGVWATDTFHNNGLKANVTIDRNIAPGNYALRHEIIALHAAENVGGAQFYPQCINLIVTGGGSEKPASTTKAAALYKETDAGIHVDIYNGLKVYPFPGPAIAIGAGATGGSGNSSSKSAATTDNCNVSKREARKSRREAARLSARTAEVLAQDE
ncbi:hypothetical protein PgNI_06497 [Pyricularia grisea]|uniref:lytic cellulose monooxygenase (C4-dehydrogenating) n=1 Tax=Pyricularia grisea TaxID=148305 RepID=A0A6P8B5F9_PYRGI|nr:hypothetical protein PgNI_06497 [Pyricularia grisea]TLD10527.1 hypothetical protein PgNI_06497 [Pyricularia grisea]